MVGVEWTSKVTVEPGSAPCPAIATWQLTMDTPGAPQNAMVALVVVANVVVVVGDATMVVGLTSEGTDVVVVPLTGIVEGTVVVVVWPDEF